MQGDAGKVKLRKAVLQPGEEATSLLSWQADCMVYAVERAGFWMTSPGSSPNPLVPASALAQENGAQQQIWEVWAGRGYVSLGGIPVPSRGAQTGTQAAWQFLRTPAAERSLQACALVLCQSRPLLLDGPPGATLSPQHAACITPTYKCSASAFILSCVLGMTRLQQHRLLASWPGAKSPHSIRAAEKLRMQSLLD